MHSLLLQKVCHGNGPISPVVQPFGSGITQFLNPEILSFHSIYDAACSTASWGPSQNLVLCCYTNNRQAMYSTDI